MTHRAGAAVRPVLRVVSYNVRGMRDDRAALARTVRDLAPDVVVVQEAPRHVRWRVRSAALARGFGVVVAAGGAPALGNLILTDLRVRVVDTWCVRFPLTPGRHLRGAAFARCELAGVRFVVAGSHLSTDPDERPLQAARLAAAVSQAGAEAPVVLGADLNDEPESLTWKAVTEILVDPAGDSPGAPTFPASAPRRRLDAVLVDPRVSVRSYRVVDSPPARRASDHLPVVADLWLTPSMVVDARAGQDRPDRE
jgi:endonuclease/exonuclease/phosphatase family metal-dependent hydrolase